MAAETDADGVRLDWTHNCNLAGAEGWRDAPRPRVLLPLLSAVNDIGTPTAPYEAIRRTGALEKFAVAVKAGLELSEVATPEPEDQEEIVQSAKSQLFAIIRTVPSGDVEDVYWDREHEELGYLCREIFVEEIGYSSDTEREEGDDAQVRHGELMNHIGRCRRAHFALRAKHEYYEMLKFLEESPGGRLLLQNFRRRLTQKDTDGSYPFLPVRTEDLEPFEIDWRGHLNREDEGDD